MAGKLRDFLNNNSAVVTILTVALLIVALGAIVLQLRPGRAGGQVVDVYYYDLDSGQIFTASSREVPPIETSTGPFNGVRAYVFACSDCGDESDRFVGWLEMYSPDAKALLTRSAEAGPPGPEAFESWEQGHLIRDPNAEEWVLANSQGGFAVMESVREQCPDGRPRPCFPGR